LRACIPFSTGRAKICRYRRRVDSSSAVCMGTCRNAFVKPGRKALVPLHRQNGTAPSRASPFRPFRTWIYHGFFRLIKKKRRASFEELETKSAGDCSIEMQRCTGNPPNSPAQKELMAFGKDLRRPDGTRHESRALAGGRLTPRWRVGRPPNCRARQTLARAQKGSPIALLPHNPANIATRSWKSRAGPAEEARFSRRPIACIADSRKPMGGRLRHWTEAKPISGG